MIIATTLLTSTPDPQRGVKWEPDPTIIDRLAASVTGFGHDLVVLHDEPHLVGSEACRDVWWAPCERTDPNPYIDRWHAYATLLAEYPDRDQVWCVDANDVVMLHQPDPVELACGSEESTLGANGWLNANHALARGLAQAHPDWPLLNAGIIGGEVHRVREVAAAVYRLARGCRSELTDMAAFNIAVHARTHLTGEPVHTRFKAYDVDHSTAWFAHK